MCILCILVLFCFIAVAPVTAYTTEVTVRRYATDGLTPISEVTKTYLWLEANLPVYGDGNTFYYYQGPVFPVEWNKTYYNRGYRYSGLSDFSDWNTHQEKWDRVWSTTLGQYIQMEEVNWAGTETSPPKNLGKLKGTDVKDLCDLVGGLPPGKTARIVASDNAYKDIPYSALYTPIAKLGPYVLTWWSEGAGEGGEATSGYTGPDYGNGMRTTFFSDTSLNPNGSHVTGLGDMADGLPSEYWYFYKDGGIDYPSLGGWSLKFIDRIYVFSNDPVPPPQTDFIANIKTGHIINGNFETSSLTPWGVNGATLYTGTTSNYKHGNASVRLIAPASGSAWISQSVDLTEVSTINFYRYLFGGVGKYLQVFVDTTQVANYTETSTVGGIQTIDLSSYGFSGTHTIKFNAVSTLSSSSFNVYLDDIEDFGPGTSGPAPLTIQFKDLSTKMEDTTHTSWAWDFQNDGSTDSTSQNPSFIYTSNGTYTVKMTATNAGGSDSEIKTGYITVGTVTPPPVANFTATPRSGTAPLVVTFTDTSTNIPTSWKWAYKNATLGWTQFSTVQNPSYTFAAGTYDINLTTTNAAGSDDEIKNGYITVSEAVSTPVANFTASPRSGTTPLAVTFTDTSTNSPTSWKWAFKNATIGWTQFATIQNPSYTFPAGTYDINLTATNAAGSDDEIKTGYIIVTSLPYIDVSISGSIDNWNFQTGTNEDTTSVDLTIDTNMDQWSVGAMDALTGSKPAGTAGKMVEYSGSAYLPSGKMLANAVQVKSGTGSYITLSGTDLPVQAGTAAGTTSYDIGMKQVVADTDPALVGDNRYRIMITFTGADA